MKNAILALHREGVTTSDIARRFGIPRSRVV